MKRVLIVNADDLGYSPQVNRGIARAHTDGIVTSASLMVRRRGAVEAAAIARALPDLSVGLHLDLGEWAYRGDDTWVPVFDVVPEEEREREIHRQVEAFRSLIGRDPTHLDSHQHVHREEPIRSLMSGVAERLRVPLRDVTPDIVYSGAFYGQGWKGYPMPQAITVDALIEIVRGLPEGITELGCHPGEEGSGDPVYDAERAVELAVLCDPRVRRQIEDQGVELRSLADLDRPPPRFR